VFVSEGSEGVKTATLSFKLNQVLSDSSLLRVQASLKKLERKEGNMPTTPFKFGHNQLHTGGILSQMVITKNNFKDTVVSDSRGSKHCITTLTKLSAGTTVIPQDFEQWTSKERQDFMSTWALCYDQVDWVNVGIDPKYLEDRNGYEYSASYIGKVFQTMEGMVIYHDSQVARNTLRDLKKIRFIYSVKSIKE
jgi:hypothetical protein